MSAWGVGVNSSFFFIFERERERGVERVCVCVWGGGGERAKHVIVPVQEQKMWITHTRHINNHG